jgi:hypothetical protein
MKDPIKMPMQQRAAQSRQISNIDFDHFMTLGRPAVPRGKVIEHRHPMLGLYEGKY